MARYVSYVSYSSGISKFIKVAVEIAMKTIPESVRIEPLRLLQT